MFYTIYKTTNLINNKYYIGKHQTTNLGDSYLGSGSALIAAIRKYNRSNFKKEILFIFESEEDMNNKERELVNIDMVHDTMSYNLGIGGEGGPHFINRHHSEYTKNKLKAFKRANPQIHAPETRAKISRSLVGRPCSAATRRKISIANTSSIHNESSRNKISTALTLHYDKVGRKGRVRMKHIPVCDSPSNQKCTINRGDDEIRIYIEELNHYLSIGWEPGRKKATREKVRISNTKLVGEKCSTYNTVWIHHDELKLNKMVKRSSLIQFLQEGWTTGVLRAHKL